MTDKLPDHEVFSQFNRVLCSGDGESVFDFLGTATKASFKKGWEKFALPLGAEFTPGYPARNEHYFDWIALLDCVSRARGVFRMAELGAGWAPWLVSGVYACRQLGIQFTDIELLGVEADAVHFDWMNQHFRRNGIEPVSQSLLHGAVAAKKGTLRFPCLDDPSVDYGASVKAQSRTGKYIEVNAITMNEILERFSGPLDFLHMDIQGEEYEVLESAMGEINNNVRGLMVGTHTSTEKHNWLYDFIKRQQCWKPVMIFPRNEKVQTGFGEVEFYDGFQYWRNTQSF